MSYGIHVRLLHLAYNSLMEKIDEEGHNRRLYTNERI
jgi:hypothetical protein